MTGMGTGIVQDTKIAILIRTRDTLTRVPAGYTRTRVHHYIYTAIKDFRSNVSGAHWDAVTGATIEGPTAEKVWNDIVKARVRYKFDFS
jgi:hypothetical protein